MYATTKDRLIPAGLIALALVPALAGSARLAEIATNAPVTPANARFFASPLPVLFHIPAAILYSMLGAFQFAPGLRKRHRNWHRWSGRALVPLGFVVTLSGLWMTLFYPWPAGDGVMVYLERLVFGTGMLVSLALGVTAIGHRAYAEHGEWMIRAFAIGLGAGTQVFTHLPWFLLVNMTPGELPRGSGAREAATPSPMPGCMRRRGAATVASPTSRGRAGVGWAIQAAPPIQTTRAAKLMPIR